MPSDVSEEKSATPKGMLVTNKKLEEKKAQIEHIQSVEMPENAREISEARAQGDLKQMIAEFSTPANSPMTIAKKGFNNPLVDTGIMLDTVDYDVEVGE